MKVQVTTLTRGVLALVIAGGLTWSSSANAGIIAGFDYGTANSPVQSGFAQVTDSTVSVTSNGVSIVADRSASTRDRTDPGGALNDLITDLHFIGDSDPVVFTLSGLAPNTTYKIIAYVWDPESGNDGKNLDWTTNGGTVQHTTDSSDPSTAAFSLEPLTTDGSGNGTIVGEHVGGAGGAVILWNGFAIVPEPGSLTLLALAGMLLLGVRRRW